MSQTPTNSCASGCRSIRIYVLCCHVSGFKVFPLPYVRPLLRDVLCNLNGSYSSLIAQTHPLGGWVHNTQAKQPTPALLQGCHYRSTSLHTSETDQNKQDTCGDLIRLPHRFSLPLSHLLWKCKTLRPHTRRSISSFLFCFCFLRQDDSGQQCWESPAVTAGSG